MPSKKLSLSLTSPQTIFNLPPPDYIRRVYACRVNAIKYVNLGGHDTLMVQMDGYNQNLYAYGKDNYEVLRTMFLGPMNSTSFFNNNQGYDYLMTFSEKDVTSLTIKLLLDQVFDPTISILNPVHMEVEFFYTEK